MFGAAKGTANFFIDIDSETDINPEPIYLDSARQHSPPADYRCRACAGYATGRYLWGECLGPRRVSGTNDLGQGSGYVGIEEDGWRR